MLAGRGFATAALLILVALTCIAIAKRLESERRMIRKLRELKAGATGPGGTDRFSEAERDTMERLRAAGVYRTDRGGGYIDPEALRAFKAKRTRFALTGALIAAGLAILIAVVVLR